MEGSSENLKTIIDLAYKESNPEKLHYIVSLIYAKADVRNGNLTRTDVDKLNKISHKAEDLATNFSVGLIYNYIFAYHLINIESFDADFVLSITNVLLPLYEKLQGTILSRRILIHLKKLFFNLTKRNEVSSDDKAQIYNILQTPKIKMDNVFENFDDNNTVKEAKELLKVRQNFQKVTATMNLMNLITDCSGIEEQISVFYKKMLNVFKGGNMNSNEHSKDLLNLLGYLIDHMFFQCEYLVKVNNKALESNQTVQNNPGLFMHFETEPIFIKHKERVTDYDENAKYDFGIISYKLAEQEATLQSRDNIYPTVAFFVNTFLLYPQDIEMQRLNIIILQRLYYGFPKYRKNIEEAIMSILSFINKDPIEANKKEASIFLYKLIQRDASPEFKQTLLSKDSFKSLFETSYYRPMVLENSKNLVESFPPKDLVVKAGFPKMVNIAAGSSFSAEIEVWRPYSIIYWAFAIADHDIVFSLTQILSFDKMMQEQPSENVPIYPPKKIEASQSQYKGTLIVKEPGIYQITFDNTGSWFNSKNIKYLLYVLEPEFDVVETPETEAGKKMLVKEEVKEPGSTPRKSSSIYESPDLKETIALIHLDKFNINFKAESKYKTYEHQFGYPETAEEWGEVNKEMLETTKKNLQKKAGQPENNLLVKFVYNKKALRSKIFKAENEVEEQPTKEFVKNKLLKTFNFLESLQDRIKEEVEVSTETEYIIKELLSSHNYSYEDSVYVLCVDNHSRTFHGGYRIHNKRFANHSFNRICFPEFNSDEEFQIRTLDEVYFGEGSSHERKISALACLLINIYEFYDELKHVIIFEDKPTDFMSENRSKAVEQFTSYLNSKKQGSTKDGEGKTKENKIIPKVDFPRVRLQEILRL